MCLVLKYIVSLVFEKENDIAETHIIILLFLEVISLSSKLALPT